MFIGVCRKVKPSYGQRGHDGDARMGDVNDVLVVTDVTCFEVFSSTVKQALHSQVSLAIYSFFVINYSFYGECEVQRIIGITDYKKMFEGSFTADIHGRC